MIAPPDLAVYRQLRAAMEQTAEHSVMFATDGGWLERAGFHCVLFGPGSIEVAHRANEFVPAAELSRAGEVLDQLVRQRCLAA
jgi:acetylornithine deacetylase